MVKVKKVKVKIMKKVMNMVVNMVVRKEINMIIKVKKENMEVKDLMVKEKVIKIGEKMKRILHD